MPLHRNGQAVGTLALVHDTSYIDTQVSHTLRDSLVNALVQTLFITGPRADPGALDADRTA